MLPFLFFSKAPAVALHLKISSLLRREVFELLMQPLRPVHVLTSITISKKGTLNHMLTSPEKGAVIF